MSDSNLCSFHGEYLKIFCNDCTKLLCLLCTIDDDHKTHALISITKKTLELNTNENQIEAENLELQQKLNQNILKLQEIKKLKMILDLNTVNNINKVNSRIKLINYKLQNQPKDYLLSDDGLTVTKYISSHCCFSSEKPCPNQWKIQYLNNITDNGWISVGVHCDPLNAYSCSDNDRNYYGFEFGIQETKHNGIREGDKFTPVNNFIIKINDIVVFDLIDNQLKMTLRCDIKYTIHLPKNKIWYAHVNAYAASLQIL